MDKCCVCNGMTDEAGQVIDLTEEERSTYPSSPERLFYCKPCWKILSDPVTGPTLVGGLAHQYLRRLGVSNAEQLAARFQSALAQKAVRRS